MKSVDKPRAAVILVRPKQGPRATQWEVVCGDCGLVSVKRAKTSAEKESVEHSKSAHEGTAVTKTRQA